MGMRYAVTNAPGITESLDSGPPRRAVSALIAASGAIISELELRAVFQRIAEQAAAVLDADGGSVLTLDTQRKQLVFEAACGPKGHELVGERFNADLGIAGQVVRTARAARVDDVSLNQNFFDGIDEKTHERTRSLLAAPMIFRGTVVGVVEVLNPRGRNAFSDNDLKLLEVFANLAAAAARQALALDDARKESASMRRAVPEVRMIGQSAAIERVRDLCRKVAASDVTVLILGETGTGKEVTSRQIHQMSPRAHKPFVALNCAAIPEALLESELFGYEKGAFTGAVAQKLGQFELAAGGTLLLDELTELSHAMQAKLLRVVEQRQFQRLGGTRSIPCDVRLLAATNRDLKVEVEKGRFRQDLYYRLCAFPIELPPVRQRVDDIPLLVEHFVNQVAPSLGVRPPAVSEHAMQCLSAYHWPGNIRELRNVVERAALLGGELVLPEHLPQELAVSAAGAQQPTSQLAAQERAMVLEALVQSDWNQSAAARKLGITRDHLRYRIKKYALRPPAGPASADSQAIA